MREKIDCFLPCDSIQIIEDTINQLRESKTVQHINLLVTEEFARRI